MKTDRKHERFVRRLETEFSSEDKNYRGISSDLSTNGLFIRTIHPFAPGSIIDITIHLPDGATSRLKGRVRRAIKTHITTFKNGMGVELIEKDFHYINFLKTFMPDVQGAPSDEKIRYETETHPKPDIKAESNSFDFLILACSKCGVKNKVRTSKMSLGPKCGKCGSALVINQA